ncbi:phage baseplate assembly protein V [Sphingobium ummariense]|uniref:Baseplate assembly protein n=1 Tax=Sphingobium ummariense RL-3 TaxID=1346791 RepID=T0K5L1_9SPHN|nr:phage baseplate assembly protein V [Sphingobium ummariense]EQB31959.1 baseplate assembly protein [Sphingobium ummariense RL-3]
MSFARMMEPLAGRIRMMVGRAVLAAIDDGKTLQTLQIELAADETQDGVEHFQPYGLSYHPKPGAEAIALSVGGSRSHAVVLAVADRRYRLIGLQEGEVALYDDQEQKVLLGRDGIVIASPLGVTVQTDGDFTVDAQGNVSIKAGGEALVDGSSILLGEGASLDAARKTDTVNSTQITGGSGKVKIA